MEKVRRILVHVCKDGGLPQPAHFLQVSVSCPQLPSFWLLTSDSWLFLSERDRLLQWGWRWWSAGELLPWEEPVHPSTRRKTPGWKKELFKGERRKFCASTILKWSALYSSVKLMVLLMSFNASGSQQGPSQDPHFFPNHGATQIYSTKWIMWTHFLSCLVNKLLKLFNWMVCLAKTCLAFCLYKS